MDVEPGPQLALDQVRVGREAAAEVDDQRVDVVEGEGVGVLAVVDQDAAEEAEQIRQSFWTEIAWQNSVVRRSPSSGTTSS